jgi:hypothetical protein
MVVYGIGHTARHIWREHAHTGSERLSPSWFLPLISNQPRSVGANSYHYTTSSDKVQRFTPNSETQENSASDWLLLSIPGLGVGRLGAVRRLIRPDWQPPSPQAVKAMNRFLSAAQFALRSWPVEALLGVVQGSPPAAPADQPAGKRLALELLSEATYCALCHCSTGELVEALRQIGHDHHYEREFQDQRQPILAAVDGR